MKKRFRILHAAFVLLALMPFVLVLASAPAPAWAEEAKRGGVLTLGSLQNPRHLNPAVQSGVATGFPGTQIFASLLRYDDDWEPKPYLAESWEVADDGLSVAFNLVRGAKFHDGMPVTAADVKFSLLAIKAYHPFKSMLAPVESIEAEGDHRVIIRLARPHPALLLSMSPVLTPIMPAHIYDDGQDLKTHPRNSENVIGSGPFRLVEFKSGEHVILERFDDFFIPGRPYLDKVIIRIITDPAARAIGIENGELQVSPYVLLPHLIGRLKRAPHLTVTDKGYAAIGPLNWLAFNTRQAPVSDKRVRQAIAYAVDKNFILDAIMRGTAPEARTGIHPASPFYYGDVNTYEYDPEKADALLDAAGFPRGRDGTRFALTIDYGWAEVKPHVEYVRTALRRVGIEVTIRAAPDFPSWAKRMGAGDFQMSWDTVFNWGDPVFGVHRSYLSSNITGTVWTNTQGYVNPRVDELLEAAGTETDIEKRRALYREFQQIVAEDVPIYFTNAQPYHTVYAHALVGNPPLGIWGVLAPLDRMYRR